MTNFIHTHRWPLVLVAMAVFLILGFGGMKYLAAGPQRVEALIKTDNQKPVEEDKISKTMSIENPNLQLSRTCKVLDNVAYWTIGDIFSSSPESFWSDIQVLKSMNIHEIKAYINSPGGDAVAGLGLADQIRIAQENDFEITMYARGLVASAAVPVFLSANHRISSKNTTFMVHPMTLSKLYAQESFEDMQTQSTWLSRMRDMYAKIIVDRTDLQYDETVEKIKKTTFFTADEAMAIGMVDGLE